MKKGLIFFSAAIMAVCLSAAVFIGYAPTAEAASAKTGVGLSEHVLKAYQQGWKYQYGCYGQFVNGVRSSDCSGLIKSYLWWTGDKTDPRPSISVAGSSSGMLSSASSKGTINYSNSSSLPRVHGLILYQPGHVGVYVGNNMAVDNRATGINMKYEKVFGRSVPKWTTWLKLPQISYPTSGLVTFRGQLYYYENGQYVVNTTRTVNGKRYVFGSSGASTSSAPAPSVAVKAEVASKSTVKSTASTQKTTAAAKSSAASQPAAAASYTDLSFNMKSDAVKQLQQRLSDLGYYYEAVNTYYDRCVEDAVKAYQAAAKIKVTGKADAATQKSLFSSSAPKNPNKGTLTPGMHSSLVKNMQARLIQLGYMSGTLSVCYNDSTKQAVLSYQKAAGLEPNGVMSAQDLDKLYSDSAVKASAASSSSASSAASSQAASSNETRMYDDILPTANAAAVGKVQTASNPSDSSTGFALFFVLASGILTGGLLLIKKVRKNGWKNPISLFAGLSRVKQLVRNRGKK
jgi:peptidoglycan hydrolase-like protein with peptidoglycan-binding domain